jgi:amidase
MHYRTAGELLKALRAGEVSAVEITDAAIARIEQHDKDINAICVPDFERARAAARAADEARAEGDDRPLLGVPITVKESYDIAGLPTTWGVPEHRDFVPAEDALPVTRVKAAGAVVLGKTNVPLMLGDFQSYNSIYGTTNNPWDLTRTPGGSSGGSSAALAAGFGAVSLGSDIGGSLRNPAHFTGTYSHKPTIGLVPSRGSNPPTATPVPFDKDLAVVGPMARTASDLALVLDLLVDPDPLSYGRAYQTHLRPPRHNRLADFRVLVVEAHPMLPISADVRAGIRRVADALTNAGARVQHESALLPDLAEGARTYARLLMSYIGARYSEEQYEMMRLAASQFDDADESFTAEAVRAVTLSHRDWITADAIRDQHRLRWHALFQEFDAVVCPVMPVPAYEHNQSEPATDRKVTIDGAEYPYFDQLALAGIATMPGLPATAIPTGLTDGGLPTGVQLLGPMFEDRTPIRLAELLEIELGGFTPPPGLS